MRLVLLGLLLLSACGKKDDDDPQPLPPPDPNKPLASFVGYWLGPLVDKEADPNFPENNPKRCVQRSYKIEDNFVSYDVTFYMNTDCATLSKDQIEGYPATLAIVGPKATVEADGFTVVTGSCVSHYATCPPHYALGFQLTEGGQKLRIAHLPSFDALQLDKANAEVFVRKPD